MYIVFRVEIYIYRRAVRYGSVSGRSRSEEKAITPETILLYLGTYTLAHV